MARRLLASKYTEEDTMVLDVGGKKFRIPLETLSKVPTTRLGALALRARNQDKKEFFFDRNPKIVNGVLDYYRTGELHVPSNLCYSVVQNELHYWGLPLDLISECCWKHVEKHREESRAMKEMQVFLRKPYSHISLDNLPSMRFQIWSLLERRTETLVSKVWQFIFFSFVMLAIVGFMLETDRHFRVPTEVYRKHVMVPRNLTLDEVYFLIPPMEFLAVTTPVPWLFFLRVTAFFFFVVDFLLRFITCYEKKVFFRQFRNWLEIVISLKTMIHIGMERVFYSLEDLQESSAVGIAFLILYVLSGIRILRILYFVNTFKDLKIVLLTMKTSIPDLRLTLLCAVTAACIFGTVTYLVEAVDGLRNFSSILEGMWCAIITLTTVGYGDVKPEGSLGKVVGSLCAVLGVVLFALPIAVISNNFKLYHKNLKSFEQRSALKRFLGANPRYSVFQSHCVPPPQHSQDQHHSERQSNLLRRHGYVGPASTSVKESPLLGEEDEGSQ